MLADIRLALRTFRQAPGFSALAVLILALGAGAKASVFAVVRAVLIEPLPYARPDRLVAIRLRSCALWARLVGAVFRSTDPMSTREAANTADRPSSFTDGKQRRHGADVHHAL